MTQKVSTTSLGGHGVVKYFQPKSNCWVFVIINSSNYNSWQLHFTDKAYLIAQVNLKILMSYKALFRQDHAKTELEKLHFVLSCSGCTCSMHIL